MTDIERGTDLHVRIGLSYTGYGPWQIYGLDLDVEAIGTR